MYAAKLKSDSTAQNHYCLDCLKRALECGDFTVGDEIVVASEADCESCDTKPPPLCYCDLCSALIDARDTLCRECEESVKAEETK